jgi:hypothetical protein
MLYADEGDLAAAEGLLDAQLAAGLPIVRAKNTAYLGYTWSLAEAAVALHRSDAAATLYEVFAPYRGRTASVLSICHGFVDRPLGRLATVLGRYDNARTHLEDAVRLHENARTPLFLARTLADQATLELASGGSTQRARDLVNRAIDIAKAHEARGVERYAQQALEHP